MRESEIRRYKNLNKIAEQGGIVIFGSREDRDIPLGELRQAFAVESNMYNRSFADITLSDAIAIYSECIAPLSPETVLLHMGENDLELFRENPAEFDNRYRELISYIRTTDSNCRIGIVSLRNFDNNAQIDEINKHLRYIANSERCEYGDIENKRVWNPQNTKDSLSFVYSLGFVHPLKNKRPLYDLVKILFCCEA